MVHDPHLTYLLRWLPELRSVADSHGPLCAREPWRLADGYRRKAKVDVRPRRDSPLWVMSVNRVHWPEYQQMMTGDGYTVEFTPASDDVINLEVCMYPPPCVPPLELEICYDRVPLDHSWGTGAATSPMAAQSAAQSATSLPKDRSLPLILSTPTAATACAEPAATAPLRSKAPSIVVWFRKALRLHDNPSLRAARDAAAASGASLLAVFVLDPWFVTSGRVGVRRLQFLLEALHDLDASLRRTLGVPLRVLRGAPTVVLPQLWRRCNVERCIWEADTEAYAQVRDAKVAGIAAEQGVVAEAIGGGHTLYDMDTLLERCAGRRPPTKYTDFLKLLEAVGPPPPPLPPPDMLPEPCLRHVLGLSSDEEVAMQVPSSLPDMGCRQKLCDDSEIGRESAEDDVARALCGGESAAMERLAEVVIARPNWVGAFSKPESNPLQWAPGSTTMLSPYLKFGCLSCRTLHAAVDTAIQRCVRPTKPPQSLHGQVAWREFFYLLAYATPNFGTASGNALCLQVPWRNPATDASAAEDLRKWAHAQTGVPLIDAAMCQLRQVGWMHHLLRHVVACFLTRGQLWIHWEAGRAVFDELLLDADWAVNTANWMWLSATCFFYTYHRVYSPTHFARRYDQSGRYVRAWLPALYQMPDEFIYEPWKAPIEVQRAAGCVIGVDYPHPMCDLEAASSANLRRMDRCYSEAPESWRELIPPAAAAEVAKERGVKLRPSRRVAAFAPLVPATSDCTAAPSPASPTGTMNHLTGEPPSAAPSTAPLSAGCASGRRGRGLSGRGRGRVSRVQHGFG